MSDCIQWHMSIRPNGYGQTFYNSKVIRAHQKAWIEVNGPVPKGMIIDHTCHNEAVAKGECSECNRVRARAVWARKKALA